MSATLELLTVQNLWQQMLQKEVHIIDVRAPIEFNSGHIPFSVCLPILTDTERADVGTTYKQQGNAKAVELGHQIVQGDIKAERLKNWITEYQKDPVNTYLTCFRGGQRSGITQRWLSENGVNLPRLKGGYKAMRQLMMEELSSFCQTQKLLVLTGKSGAGKTQLLNSLKNKPVVDLEFLAKHRGSSFGKYNQPQPSQSDYENTLSLQLNRWKHHSANSPVLVEDESRMIGSIVQPNEFFELLRSSPVIYLDEPLEARIENTLQEYVVAASGNKDLFIDLQVSLNKLKSKLGGLRHQELIADLQAAHIAFVTHKDFSASRKWIEKLLVWYYDPLYEKSFAKRNPKVLFKASKSELLKTDLFAT